jgi:Tfp pilus assembly protein PilN
MPAFNLMPWRARQQQRARWLALWIGLGWLLGVMVWWGLQALTLQQEQAELLHVEQHTQWRDSPSPKHVLRQAWQHEPRLSLLEGAIFWSALADLTPPTVYLKSVHWQADAVLLKGVAEQTNALAQLLASILQQPSLRDPQWVSWEPDAQAGTQFELALQWSAEAAF